MVEPELTTRHEHPHGIDCNGVEACITGRCVKNRPACDDRVVLEPLGYCHDHFSSIAADSATAARRPNLTNTPQRTEIERLLQERTPNYRACATLEVDTEGKAPAEIADEIVACPVDSRVGH